MRLLTSTEDRAVPAFVPLRLIWYMAFRLRHSPQGVGANYFAQRLAFLEAWMHNFGLA